MDRNQTIGFLLIGALFVGYFLYNKPSAEEIQKQKQEQLAKEEKQENVTVQNSISKNIPQENITETTTEVITDSILQEKLGIFSMAFSDSTEFSTIETDDLLLTFSSKGAMLHSAILKNYKTYDQKPLELLNPEQTSMNIQYFYAGKQINTKELQFQKYASSSQSITYRLNTAIPEKYIDFIYEFDKETPFVINFKISAHNFQDLIQQSGEEVSLDFSLTALSKEKNLENEKNTSTIYYKYKDEDRDYISERDYSKVDLIAKAEWIAFKQQFFSTALISKEGFSKTNGFIETKEDNSSPLNIKNMRARVSLPLPNTPISSCEMKIYMGPNHYKTLKSLDHGMEKIIDLGWGIFGWVNQFLVIPVFNFFDGFHWSYGVIILMLTLVFKILLFPVTYKNYVSSAKMKVLKPEVDSINERFKEKDPLQKQQAMMDLYRKTGVNPLAGCIPLLIQMPILFALFRFFPASIELRQEKFLWAEDLSTYDSILDLSFNIPFYGSHVSLFAILMAISTFLYSKMNMQVTTMSGPQAQQMKIMTYFMPFMLLFFFNSTAAGLSYYYFAANMISIAQQWVIKKYFIDEKAIHAKIEANKIKIAKNPKKKSSWQQRLEEMAKQKGYQKK